MEGFVGVSYRPLMVSTQVVNGTNYRFECEAKIVSPDASIEQALIEIYQPLDEMSTQVVAGMNYRFICEAKVVAPKAEPCHD
ncbi:hypothetical protein [uncultured Shewanella sp.]|uniref:hypothetical protein n=1 Tax=uncultured Shewanella sp. TaxID=173975 RepID=UPI002608C399|nr:hypothetical protein [uncultured Shewanella sp.]